MKNWLRKLVYRVASRYLPDTRYPNPLAAYYNARDALDQALADDAPFDAVSALLDDVIAATDNLESYGNDAHDSLWFVVGRVDDKFAALSDEQVFA